MGMMIFMPIILAVVAGVILLLLFIATAIGVGISGAAASKFVKNKAVKRLIVLGSMIALFVGLMFLWPFAVGKFEWSNSLIPWGMSLFCVLIGIFAVWGAKSSKALQSKVIQVVVAILFYLLLVAVFCFLLFIIIVVLLV